MYNYNGDDYLAADKFEHILFCFTITLITSLLSSRSPFSLLRRRPILTGAVVSAGAGVAKEVADELGFFGSAGASVKDGVADLVGVCLGVIVLVVWKRVFFRVKIERKVFEKGVEIV